MTDSLVAILDTMLLDPEYVTLAHSLFPGASSPSEIAFAVEAICRIALAAEATECFYAELSVGAVFGLRLSDNRRVALKLHQPSAAHSEIAAVARVQQFLYQRGFPCSGILRDPLHDGVRTITFEEWSTPGEEREASNPEVRDAMARLLARQVRDAARCRAYSHLRLDLLPQGLWHAPHNNLFDFDRTSAGAEWIDDRARTAHAILEGIDGPVVPGHMDWLMKHFRFHPDGEVATVYDWDSLLLTQEVRVVGSAAATFTVRFDPVPKRITHPEEARAFVSTYETARGIPFSREEWKNVSAAALYVIAYGARCEHAVRGPAPQGMFRERVREPTDDRYFEV